MKVIDWNGEELTIMREITDKEYGRIWIAYLDYRKVYIVEGRIVEEQNIIDDLDNKYGIPVNERGLDF